MESFETHPHIHVGPLPFALGHEPESTGLEDLEISWTKISTRNANRSLGGTISKSNHFALC